MSNTTDMSGMTFKRGGRKASVKMAYTINDYQPVQCTMISDQPFFYMDEDISLDEEALHEEALLNGEHDFNFEDMPQEELEQELLQFKTKIDAYERVSLDFSKKEDERHQQFLMDSHFLTNPSTASEPDYSAQKILDALEHSRYTRELLAFASNNKIEIILSDQVQLSAYDKKASKILIRASLDITDQILLCVQELRRHWQHHNGALVHPLTFHPDQAVLINRAQIADLSVAVVRGAWEMKLSGYGDLWTRIESSSLSDLGRALAREALSDFRTLNNGVAASAVFETWFLSERCRAQDKKLIQSMLADYRGYVFDSSEASRMVSIDLISALGEQPIGKNYLASFAQMIMSDSIFTDVRDRANANFLWFIKFEREFTQAEQETEQELQPSKLINTSGDLDQVKNNDITEDTNHEHLFTSEDQEQLRQSIFSSSQGVEQTRSDNNVIHVQFGADKQSCEGISS